jgi:uncharacterized protein
MYAFGHGVLQDYAEAIKWSRLAANQGYADAQFNLGIAYANGQGVPKDYAEGAMWLRRAADQGLPLAQLSLGVAYALGHGVQQDFVSAHMWFSLSAAQGNQDAVKDRDRAAGNMTPAQIAEAQKLAREWKPIRQAPAPP